MDKNDLYRLLVEVFGEQYVTRKDQFRINCINCEDQTGNLEVSLSKGVCHCWKCSYSGTVRQLLFDYLGYVPDIQEEFRTVEDFKALQADYSPEIVKKYVKLPQEFCPLWVPPKSKMGQLALQYISKRLSTEEIQAYHIGYCGLGRYRQRIIIPTFEDEKVVYFIARAIFPNPKRYDNPTKEEGYAGSDEVVFNIDQARQLDRAVLCEGVFDAIRVGEDGVALFGSDISDTQFLKLSEISNIYVMLDSPRKDPNAAKKAIKVADRFQEYRRSVHLIILSEGDPGIWPRKELRKFIDEAKPYTPAERLLAFTK